MYLSEGLKMELLFVPVEIGGPEDQLPQSFSAMANPPAIRGDTQPQNANQGRKPLFLAFIFFFWVNHSDFDENILIFCVGVGFFGLACIDLRIR